MKCARAASESSAEQRGRPSGAPAAHVGGRAAGGGAPRDAQRTMRYAVRRTMPPAASTAARRMSSPSATPFRSLCRLPPPLHDIVPAAILLAARCPSRNLLLVARSPLCRPLLVARHPLLQFFASSATSLPVSSPVAKQKNGNLSTKCTERRDGWHKKPRNALFPIAA